MVNTFVPKIGDYIVVDLPGERARGRIVKVSGENAAVVQITTITTSRLHSYQIEDLVAVRRSKNAICETWEAIKAEPKAAEAPKAEAPERVREPKKGKKKDAA